ncbi:MAG: hypothetical protein ACK4ST_06065, partial [Elioraea tepidiphila]
IAAAAPPPRPLPTYALASLELVGARAVLEDRIADFMAEVAAYWTADPLEAELAPQLGPPDWAVLAAAEAVHGAACS